VSYPGVQIIETADGGREFVLAERGLTWIRIDFQTRLQFGEAELVIETPFRLSRANAEHSLDPKDRAGLGPLLALYPDTLGRMTMTAEGTLSALFVSGATLTVPPDPRYEAWNLGGFWCVAGGFA
jgi:hypothetical protein